MKGLGLFIPSPFMQQWCVPGPVLLVDSGYAVQETGLSTALEGLRGDGEERIIEEVYI